MPVTSCFVPTSTCADEMIEPLRDSLRDAAVWWTNSSGRNGTFENLLANPPVISYQVGATEHLDYARQHLRPGNLDSRRPRFPPYGLIARKTCQVLTDLAGSLVVPPQTERTLHTDLDTDLIMYSIAALLPTHWQHHSAISLPLVLDIAQF
ncbi:hypothetical protein FA15DRAFT_211006 [Coprinopsis marcescibilis]|uniref:Uncharacterized protein n=1 Tax=Coprinopsis marcescibilis TaxID=230819 RepID=A0A5C3L2Z4_COPMA|nr:hypothetical protein FA15DRAFT_211006 [Coprinopsis marcescibilis]